MGSKNATVSAAETDDIDPSEYRLLCYWCARKRWGFKDEFVGSQPLDARFFSHLGRLGQVRLTKIHQDELKLALLHYSPPSRSLQAHRANWAKIERFARALINAVQVGDYPGSLEFHITPSWVERRGDAWWQTFAEVLENIASEAKTEIYMIDHCWPDDLRKRSRPKNQAAIDLVQTCGDIFRSAGGRPTVSNNAGEYRGPFVEFLREIWRVIPANRRPTKSKLISPLGH